MCSSDLAPHARPTPAAWRHGIAVHAALEAAYRDRMLGRPLADTVPDALTALGEAWTAEGLPEDPAWIRRTEAMVRRTLTDDPIAADTVIEADAVIGPYVVFGPGAIVRKGVEIKAFSHIEGAQVGAGAIVGPYARLRPGAVLEEGVHIGNFVEIKNARLEKGVKANHLAYVGDARVGEGSNIGAGTITCNYDGAEKHRTGIGAGVFVGSNSTLVAPVEIGDGAYIAAGSVITDKVEAEALALGRARQAAKPGRAKTMRDARTRSEDEDE